jgi:hypothetical protein
VCFTHSRFENKLTEIKFELLTKNQRQMKYKTKNNFLIGIFLSSIILLLTRCQNDEIVPNINADSPAFQVNIAPWEHVKSVHKNIESKVGRYINGNDILKRSTSSETHGFTINDNNVQIIETDGFTTFTFMVFRDDTEDSTILENYVLKEYADGSYEQFLLKYDYTEDEEGNRTYDTDALDIEFIEDDSLLFSRNSCTPEFVEVLDDFVCTTRERCTGPGQHEDSNGCLCTPSPNDCMPAGTICEYEYVWVFQGCSSGGGGSGTTGDDNGSNDSGGTGGGGGGSSNNNTNQNDNDDEGSNDNNNETPAIPFDDLSERQVQKECKKIKDFLDDPDNAAFRQRLLEFSNPSNYAENLDVEFEKSISFFENSNTLDERQGNENQASVEILVNPANKYKAFAHTHPNDSEGTYSVFSFEDLEGISNILANNKLDTGTFVAFLITKKGENLTYYAMTINKKSKFQDFFYYYNDNDFDFFTATQEEKDKRTESFNKANSLRKKYYSHQTSPLISSFNVNSQQMLTQFLKFMGEADMGATLFTTDANFSDFKRVSFDATNINGIKEQNCND